MIKIFSFALIFILTVGHMGIEAKELYSKKRHKVWCESRCMDSVFNNFHTKGESWGTSSSSLSVTQTDIFDKVVSYCREIYKSGCYMVEYEHPSAIHGNIYFASPDK